MDKSHVHDGGQQWRLLFNFNPQPREDHIIVDPRIRHDLAAGHRHKTPAVLKSNDGGLSERITN